MLVYRVRRAFETKAYGTLRVGQHVDPEVASDLRNLKALVNQGFLVVVNDEATASTPNKGKRK